jgi:hypothetical protein
LNFFCEYFVVIVYFFCKRGEDFVVNWGREGLRVEFPKTRGQNIKVTLRLILDVGSRSDGAEDDRFLPLFQPTDGQRYPYNLYEGVRAQGVVASQTLLISPPMEIRKEHCYTYDISCPIPVRR